MWVFITFLVLLRSNVFVQRRPLLLSGVRPKEFFASVRAGVSESEGI